MKHSMIQTPMRQLVRNLFEIKSIVGFKTKRIFSCSASNVLFIGYFWNNKPFFIGYAMA